MGGESVEWEMASGYCVFVSVRSTVETSSEGYRCASKARK